MGDQIADFRQQHFAFSRCRGCGRGRFLLVVDFADGFDQPEDRKCNDQELDDGIQEQADIERYGASLLRFGKGRHRRTLEGDEDVGEIDTARQQADDRREDIFHQAGDDGGKGGADDDTDSHVDNVSAHDEFLKFTDPAGRVDFDFCFAHVVRLLLGFTVKVIIADLSQLFPCKLH